MDLSRDISKTWPIFNEIQSKGTNYQGNSLESLRRPNFVFVKVEDYSDLFIQIFHYEIVSMSTIFEDGPQEPYPGSDKR
ncbi:MAG: hypothetical protein M1161_00195 [Candidatus Thermoplasmatota archaeon]|jgi:hypothetical protein|nr:hypothetical protein [Candidatus Thermoplasmatota archaeon]